MWSGHFHRDRKIVIAGFCEAHRSSLRAPNVGNCEGCFGKRLIRKRPAMYYDALQNTLSAMDALRASQTSGEKEK